jgi:hypothetical protein
MELNKVCGIILVMVLGAILLPDHIKLLVETVRSAGVHSNNAVSDTH